MTSGSEKVVIVEQYKRYLSHSFLNGQIQLKETGKFAYKPRATRIDLRTVKRCGNYKGRTLCVYWDFVYNIKTSEFYLYDNPPIPVYLKTTPVRSELSLWRNNRQRNIIQKLRSKMNMIHPPKLRLIATPKS